MVWYVNCVERLQQCVMDACTHICWSPITSDGGKPTYLHKSFDPSWVCSRQYSGTRVQFPSEDTVGYSRHYCGNIYWFLLKRIKTIIIIQFSTKEEFNVAPVILVHMPSWCPRVVTKEVILVHRSADSPGWGGGRSSLCTHRLIPQGGEGWCHHSAPIGWFPRVGRGGCHPSAPIGWFLSVGRGDVLTVHPSSDSPG